jgi:hypothetical protein
MYQAMRATAPNLFLGNTVLLKPAEICAGSLMFDELFLEAGFPAGLYQTVLAPVDQISTYIADPPHPYPSLAPLRARWARLTWLGSFSKPRRPMSSRLAVPQPCRPMKSDAGWTA